MPEIPIHSRTIALIALLVAVLFSPLALAEAREQKVRLQVTESSDSGRCQVQAVFKGDHDNCKNDKAKGRSDCSKDNGCICTRQEKHVSWDMKGEHTFHIEFDQGSTNPFVAKGDNECQFKSNKKGKLRCRVKGKDVPKGTYRYSIHAENCAPATARFKVY